MKLQNWINLGALAVLGTAPAYVLYFGILSSAGSTSLSLVTYLILVVSVSLGCVLLGEQVGGRELLATAVIIGGLVWVDPSLVGRTWWRVRDLVGGVARFREWRDFVRERRWVGVAQVILGQWLEF